MPGSPPRAGRHKLERTLRRQITRLGAEIVDPSQADMIIADGHVEESSIHGKALIGCTPAREIIFYVGADHDPHPNVSAAMSFSGKIVRRFQKPVTPSLLREALSPGQARMRHEQLLSTAAAKLRSNVTRSNASSQNGDKEVVQPGKVIPESKPKAHFEADSSSPLSFYTDPKGVSTCPIVAKLCSFWKPKNLPVEDAVACLSLGDYVNSHRRNALSRTPSLGESSTYAASSQESMPETPRAESEQDPQEHEMENGAPMISPEAMPVEEEPEAIKVLVVEDNRINRKILVKLISSKTSKVVRGDRICASFFVVPVLMMIIADRSCGS